MSAFFQNRLFRVQQSLKKSSAIRERYISLAPAIILVLDTDGNIAHLNHHGCSILGCSIEQVQGKPWIDTFIPVDARDSVRRVFQNIIGGEIEPYREVEHEVITQKGAVRTIHWHNTELTDESGTITGILSYGEDVTEKKRREETIHTLQLFQEGIIANANVWITVLSPKGKILVWNDAAVTISGYTKEEALGTTSIWKRLYPDTDYRKWVTGEIDRVITRDTYLEDFETEIRCRDGSQKTIAWNTKGLRNAEGNVENFIAVGRDVTERRNAEDALQKSQSLLSNAMDLAHMASWEFDVGTGMFTFDDRFYALYGTTAEREGGYRMPAEVYAREFVHPDDMAVVGEEVRKAVETYDPGYTSQVEHRIIRRDGAVRHMIVRISITKDSEGRTIMTHGANQDITERRQAEEALKESEKRYRDLFNNANDIIIVHEITPEMRPGAIIDANERCCVTLGYTQEELLRLMLEDITFHQSPDEMAAIGRDLIETGSTTFLGMLKRKNGDTFPVEVSAHLFSHDKKQFNISIIRDITERKKAELELKKLASIVEHAEEFIGLSNPEGNIIFLNDAGARMIGVDPKEAISRKFVEFMPEHQMDVLQNEVFPGLHRKESWEGDLQFQNQSTGQMVDVHSMIFTIDDPVTGDPLNLANISLDITERKKMEEALRESEEKYRAYIENAVESIFIADKNGRYLDVNPSACQLVGYTRDELLSLSIPDLSDPDNLETAMAGFNTLLAEGRVVQEISLKKKDGTLVPVILNAVMLPDGNLMAFCTDITRRKMTEDALALASKKLNLLSSITRHDILNQLMVLIGYLDMAVEDVTDPEQRHSIEVEMQAAKTIQRQIEFTREYQELGLQAPVWLNINESLMQATANLPMRDVKVSIDRTDLEVFADRLFEKVFYNLIDNALRYGGDHMTSISLSLRVEDDSLVIIFEDNGTGISAEDKRKLFTRGFGKNTGLGLFLSREILAITGISIKETGEPGKGARFEIIVPNGMYRFTGLNSTGNKH